MNKATSSKGGGERDLNFADPKRFAFDTAGVALQGGNMPSPTTRKEAASWAVLAFLLLIFVALRLRWVGHLLAWDEAMTLNTVRTLFAGGDDQFAIWFWRHPPLLTGLTMLLRPLANGFAERVELLAIGFNLAAALVLWALNRSVFGNRVALFSVGFFAVLPGAVFFDTWCKGDPGTTLFGLAAIWCVVIRRDSLAGLSLACAFLSKELAVFFAVAIALLVIFMERRIAVGRLVRLFMPSVIALALWYGIALMRPGAGLETSLLEHFHFAKGTDEGWRQSPFYYLQQLWIYLGPAGFALAALGTAWLLAKVLAGGPAEWRRIWRRGPENVEAGTSPARFWPVLLLGPAYLVLSALPSKVPWLTMSLFPAWATLGALGLDWLAGWILRRVEMAAPLRQAALSGGVLAFCMVVLASEVLRGGYEEYFRRVDKGQWLGSSRSFANARGVNASVATDQRLLFTSFHYWKGIPPGFPCAVFSYYLRKDIPVLVRRHDLPIEVILRDAERFRIVWLLISPEPGPEARTQFRTLMEERKLEPIRLDMAWLFRLSPEPHGVSAAQVVSRPGSAKPGE